MAMAMAMVLTLVYNKVSKLRNVGDEEVTALCSVAISCLDSCHMWVLKYCKVGM